MAKATAELTMQATPAAVWAVVSDFHDLASWMPGVESSRAEGDDRIVAMLGMEIRERLVRRDDDRRVLVYSIVDGAPIEHHEVTITVHDGSDGGSRVTWDVDATPDDMASLMQGIYQQSLESLKTHVGG